jgi:tetratricopeptide (TPR) repeat protein
MEIAKDNYQFFFRKLLEVDDEYLTRILKNIFSVTKRHTDLKPVIRDISRDHALFARFLNNRGMWEEARNEYMMAIKLEPSNPIRYAEFANAFSSRRDFGNAITWWQKQKMINPQDEAIYLSLNYGFMRLNRFDDALRELHELTKLNPENINYQIKLIRTLIKADRVDEAIKEYHEILEKNPNLSKEMYDSLQYFQKKGNYKHAVKILNKALVSTLNR